MIRLDEEIAVTDSAGHAFQMARAICIVQSLSTKNKLCRAFVISNPALTSLYHT